MAILYYVYIYIDCFFTQFVFFFVENGALLYVYISEVSFNALILIKEKWRNEIYIFSNERLNNLHTDAFISIV